MFMVKSIENTHAGEGERRKRKERERSLNISLHCGKLPSDPHWVLLLLNLSSCFLHLCQCSYILMSAVMPFWNLGVVKRPEDSPNLPDTHTRRIFSTVHKHEEEEKTTKTEETHLSFTWQVWTLDVTKTELQWRKSSPFLQRSLIKVKRVNYYIGRGGSEVMRHHAWLHCCLQTSKHPKRWVALLLTDWSWSCSRWNVPRWSCKSVSRRSFGPWRDFTFQSSCDKSRDLQRRKNLCLDFLTTLPVAFLLR